MDTRLLCNRNNIFQRIIVVDIKGNGSFVIIVFRKHFFQFIHSANDMNTPVGMPQWFVVIQNSVDGDSPLRMRQETVNITLCRTTVTN